MTGQELTALPAGAPPEKLSFGQMLKRAEIFSRTQLVGPDLQGKPEAIVLVGARGAELGVPFALALQEIYVIKNRTFVSTQLRLALVRRAGHEVRFVESSAERAVIKGRRKENRHDPEGWVTATWTIADAHTAKLTEKDVWKSFPADMLRARAAGALSRMEFSDVLLGMDLDLDTADEAGFAHLDLEDAPEPDEAPDPSDEDGDAEEVEDAVVVEDLAPGPEPTIPSAPAPDEAPPPPARSGPPVPRPAPGERSDVTVLKWRLNSLDADGRKSMRAWLVTNQVPDLADVSTEIVAKVNAELDRRGVAQVTTTGHDTLLPPETDG